MLNRTPGFVNRFALFVIGTLVGLACISPAVADDGSEALLSKYFEAIGGRAVWADGHGEYVLAKIRDSRFPLPGTFEICFNWDKPQTADRFRVQDSTQYRVFTGREGWTLNKLSGSAPGQISDWDDDRKKRGYFGWSDNLEVLTHKMAMRDRKVSTRMGDGPWKEWIEISTDQKPVAYFLVNEDGSPRRFQRLFDGTAVVFGPMATRGRLNFPATASFEGGEPFDLIAFEILDQAPVEPFRKPGANDAGYMHCR